ncbi:SRPBCC family protein [Halobacteria archaeon HArc-gm2]|nr:SRPBCC family protein [Halobacteria archaeon HArc-gm2]
MTIRVQRELVVDASPERVWEFIADPDRRAAPLSVVEDWTVHDDGSATWQVALPIPIVDRTITVETKDVERRQNEYVKFTGKSSVMRVNGEHRLEAVDGGTRLTNTFVVDGRLPGVERFFERNLDRELSNLEDALRTDLEDGP